MPDHSTDQFIVDDILPARQVHLIGGPSGSGKTTWMCQAFFGDWQEGRPLLGHPSHPAPWLYVACDRNRESVQHTLARCGLAFDPKTMCSITDFQGSILLPELHHRFPWARVWFIEALDMMMPEGDINSRRQVASFLRQLSKDCQTHNVTLVGTVHSPKQTQDHHYNNPRDRITGSAAWSAFAETLIVFEPTGPTTRHVDLLPRNAAAESFDFELDDHGLLVLVADSNTSAETALELLLRSKVGKTIKRGEIDALGATVGISKATVGRIIERFIIRGLLERTEHGIYLVRLPQ